MMVVCWDETMAGMLANQKQKGFLRVVYLGMTKAWMKADWTEWPREGCSVVMRELRKVDQRDVLMERRRVVPRAARTVVMRGVARAEWTARSMEILMAGSMVAMTAQTTAAHSAFRRAGCWAGLMDVMTAGPRASRKARCLAGKMAVMTAGPRASQKARCLVGSMALMRAGLTASRRARCWAHRTAEKMASSMAEKRVE